MGSGDLLLRVLVSWDPHPGDTGFGSPKDLQSHAAPSGFPPCATTSHCRDCQCHQQVTNCGAGATPLLPEGRIQPGDGPSPGAAAPRPAPAASRPPATRGTGDNETL